MRRAFFQRFLYFAIYNCKACGHVEKQDQWFLFPFSKLSRCPRCGSFAVHRLRGVDKIDPLYKNPISYLQKFFGADIHWCPFCRLQFYDLRKRAAPPPKNQPIIPGQQPSTAK